MRLVEVKLRHRGDTVAALQITFTFLISSFFLIRSDLIARKISGNNGRMAGEDSGLQGRFLFFVLILSGALIAWNCFSPLQESQPAADKSQWHQKARYFASEVDGKVESVIARCPSGEVAGTRVSQTVDAFRGIPFASAARWQEARPLPEPAWEGVLEANTTGDLCPQLLREKLRKAAERHGRRLDQSENCLFLNIYRPTPPRETDQKLLPVMVWIHGGSFLHGAGSLYDGSVLSLGNVMVVTVNYRLGVLGFLQLGDLESPELANYALTDLSQALHWVKRNIESFGGDPSKVTLFGESAGGALVGWLLLGTDLLPSNTVTGAIVQSGVPTASWAWRSTKRATEDTQRFAATLGCDGPPKERNACLHAKTTDELLKAQLQLLAKVSDGFATPAVEILYATPSIDNNTISLPPHQILQSGNVPKIPVIIGTTAQEMSYFLLWREALVQKATEEKFTVNDWTDFVLDRLALLTSGERLLHLPERFQDILYNIVTEQYQGSNMPNKSSEFLDMIVTFWSDTMFVCPAHEMSQSLSQLGNRVHSYLYTLADSRFPEWVAATHTAELDFVFGSPLLGKPGSIYAYHDNVSFDAASTARSEDMMRLWTEFALQKYRYCSVLCMLDWVDDGHGAKREDLSCGGS